MTRRLAGELALHLLIAVVLVAAPAFGPLREAVGFDLPARAALAMLLLGCAWVRRPSLRPPDTLLKVALVATAAAQLTLLVGTDRPASVLWSLYVVSLWENARHPRGGWTAFAVACATPWLTLFLFARIHEGIFLAVPLTLSLFGPPLHLALRSRARRVRALEELATVLRLATRRAQADQDRAQLLEGVERRLRTSLARIQAQADTLERSLQAGQDVTGEALTALARAALHELRDAVWALDPSDGRWASVEAHLRRVAADFGAASLGGALQPEETVNAGDRLALLRRLRALDQQVAGRALRVMRNEGNLTLEIVDTARLSRESA